MRDGGQPDGGPGMGGQMDRGGANGDDGTQDGGPGRGGRGYGYNGPGGGMDGQGGAQGNRRMNRGFGPPAGARPSNPPTTQPTPNP
jgi:hypothetical protein